MLSPTEEMLIEFVAYVATCKRQNTEEWMLGLGDRMNEVLEKLNDEDRLIYSVPAGEFRAITVAPPAQR